MARTLKPHLTDCFLYSLALANTAVFLTKQTPTPGSRSLFGRASGRPVLMGSSLQEQSDVRGFTIVHKEDSLSCLICCPGSFRSGGQSGRPQRMQHPGFSPLAQPSEERYASCMDGPGPVQMFEASIAHLVEHWGKMRSIALKAKENTEEGRKMHGLFLSYLLVLL